MQLGVSVLNRVSSASNDSDVGCGVRLRVQRYDILIKKQNKRSKSLCLWGK